MNLPARIQKPAKRSGRIKCPAHRAWIRGFVCLICGTHPTECAHVRMNSGAGMGEKPDDSRCVPLCPTCHRTQHAQGEPSFYAKHKIDIEAVLADFVKASPHRNKLRPNRP